MFYQYCILIGSDKLICCLFYCLSQGISHSIGLLAWRRVYDFSFSIVQVHFVFFLIVFHYVYFPSLI